MTDTATLATPEQLQEVQHRLAHPASTAPLRIMQPPRPDFLEPQNFEDMLRFADMMARSTLVPEAYRSKPNDVFVAVSLGKSVGLTAMQSLQGIAVIGNRPSLWGDALIGVVRSHPLCESIVEIEHDLPGSEYGWTVVAKRRGDPNPITRKFTMDDAVTAGLTNKPGPWKQYPKRMCLMRARAFACRDAFPDVLKGLAVVEEIIDVPPAVRESIVNAPTRGEALTRALEARQEFAAEAPSQVPHGSKDAPVAEDDVPSIAALEALLKGKDGTAVRDLIDSTAADLGVPEHELKEVQGRIAGGRLQKKFVPAILRELHVIARDRAAAEAAAAAAQPTQDAASHEPEQTLLEGDEEIPLGAGADAGTPAGTLV